MRRAALRVVLLLLALAGCSSQRDCYGAVVEVRLEGGSAGVAASFFGYPAPFGSALGDAATPAALLAAADPATACGGAVVPAAVPGASAALVTRGNCSFVEKAWALQHAGYTAMLLANTEPDCVLIGSNHSDVEGLTLAVASLTQEAGDALADALAQFPGGGLTVTLRMPAEGPVDWSAVALWLIATGTVAGGAVWAGRGHLSELDRDSSTPTARKGGGAADLPSVTIDARAAGGFVFVASGVLVLLFFFLNQWLAYILVGLFALGACQACGLVFFSALQHLSTPHWRASYVRLPLAGLVPPNGAAAGAAAGALCLCWAVWHNAVWSWPLQDTMGVCFMLVILKQFNLPNLKVASILLCLAFVYDVWWVFLQPLVTGGASVMVAVASGGASHEQLPMVLRFPHHALGSNPAFSLLGLGDVVLPGLLVTFCRRYDLNNRLAGASSYFLPCVLGYGSGLLLTYCALWFSWFGDSGQPALLYLVPGTLGTVSALALCRGRFAALWSNEFETGAGGGASGSGRGGGGGEEAAEAAAGRDVEAGLDRARLLQSSGSGSSRGSP